MTAQELKNSILQLAVQGKLVPQNPADESATDLLKRIVEEKSKMIDEGKIKKVKKFPAITDEEKPFELPNSWVWVRLRDIVYNRAQEIPSYTFSYIDIGSINNTKQKLNEKENIILSKNAPSRARKVVEFGDILYATVRPYLHNMCIVDKIFYHKPIASTGFAAMACLDGVCNKYLLYYLMSPPFDKYANATDNAKGMAYPAINDDKLYRALIALPPYDEQKRIVEKIEELFPLVEEYDKVEKQLTALNKSFPDKLRKSILQQAVQGKLSERYTDDEPASELLKRISEEKVKLIEEGKVYREKELKAMSNDDIPFDIPDEWEWCKLGELTRLITKGSSPSWQGVAYTTEDKGILFVTSENVGVKNMLLEKRKFVEPKFNEMHPASILQKGDLLTNIVGASIGRTAVFEEDIENANINQAVCIIRLVDYTLSEYLLMYLNSATAINIMTAKSVDSARANLSLTSVTNLLVPVPPLAEQKRIVARVKELLAVCDKLK